MNDTITGGSIILVSMGKVNKSETNYSKNRSKITDFILSGSGCLNKIANKVTVLQTFKRDCWLSLHMLSRISIKVIEFQ